MKEKTKTKEKNEDEVGLEATWFTTQEVIKLLTSHNVQEQNRILDTVATFFGLLR